MVGMLTLSRVVRSSDNLPQRFAYGLGFADIVGSVTVGAMSP